MTIKTITTFTHLYRYWLVILVTLALPTQADDTEIYTTSHEPVDVKSNLLLVYDLSSSMTELEDNIRNPFDPEQDYTDALNTVDRNFYSDNYFFSIAGDLGGDPDDALAKRIPNSNNHCQAARDAFNRSGYYIDQMIQDTGTWTREIILGGSPGTIECKGDFGKHGHNTNNTTTKTYPHNNKIYYPDCPFGGLSCDYVSNINKAHNWNDTTSQPYGFYSAKYMRWYRFYRETTSAEKQSRLDILKEATTNLVNSTDSINAGLIVTNRWANGGHVRDAMADLSESGNKASLNTSVDELSNAFLLQGTSLTEAFWEARQYYTGTVVEYGRGHSTPPSGFLDFFDPDKWTTADRSDLGALANNTSASGILPSGTRYETPITHQCQKNHTVLFSDGTPSFDSGKDNAIDALLNPFNQASLDIELRSGCGSNKLGSGRRSCMPTLAYALNNSDLNSTLPGKQTVQTHTIGYRNIVGKVLLEDTARFGGGKFYLVESAQQLQNALSSILIDVYLNEATFVSPAVAVNAFNRLEHRDELYYAIFRPSETRRWPGNLKRYRLGVDENGKPAIMDRNSNPAVDPNTGFFKADSASFWPQTIGATAISDGKNVELGGVAGQLGTNRKVFTYTGDYADLDEPTAAMSAVVPDSFAVNGAVDNTLLQLPDDITETERSRFFNWIKGQDASGNPHHQFGDAIHSQPVVVNYRTYTGIDNKKMTDSVVFVGTNDGYLHAIDAATGQELSAFIPKELLPNLFDYYRNTPGIIPRPYGLDGPITVAVFDYNNDGLIYASDNTLQTTVDNKQDRVILFVGMRRGGVLDNDRHPAHGNYYAVDYTDREAPKLLWVIKGGEGDFARLGQTWSRLQPATIRFNGEARKVLIFGGGYDRDQDTATTRATDDTGNAIYIVDAMTGERLWWASNADSNLNLLGMDYSITGNIFTADGNGDGLVETLFASDIGGNLWRIDLRDNPDNENLTRITGVHLAQLSGADASDTDDTRRFYHGPSVAAEVHGGLLHYTIAIGSGYHAKPLSQSINDRFYMVRNGHVGNPMWDDENNAALSWSPITESNLYDITDETLYTASDVVTEGETLSPRQVKQNAFNAKQGWMLDLDSNSHEKVLAPARTAGGIIFFTTFRLVRDPESSCFADPGRSRLYMVSQRNGRGVVAVDGGYARFVSSNMSGIATPGAEIRTSQGNVIPYSTELVESPLDSSVSTIFWRDNWTSTVQTAIEAAQNAQAPETEENPEENNATTGSSQSDPTTGAGSTDATQ